MGELSIILVVMVWESLYPAVGLGVCILFLYHSSAQSSDVERCMVRVAANFFSLAIANFFLVFFAGMKFLV